MGSLQKVFLSSEVFLICTAHGLSTDKEEIMGLLIGWTDMSKGYAYITNCVQLKRLDKRKDRVEISDEQQVKGMAIADDLNQARQRRRELGTESDLFAVNESGSEGPMLNALRTSLQTENLRVLGWYHSHPHITVFPSEVDIRTQNQYQEMDPMWAGLIFGVFNFDQVGNNRQQYIAFQSEPKFRLRYETDAAGIGSTENNSSLQHRMVPVLLVPKNRLNLTNIGPITIDKSAIDCLVELPKLVLEEGREAFEKATSTRSDGETKTSDKPKRGDTIVAFHNANVYGQAVCKVVGRLITPMIAALQTRKDVICASNE